MSTIRIKYLFLLVALVFLVLFLMEIDSGLCWEQLSLIGFGMIPILLVSFLAYLFATMAWQLCYYAILDTTAFRRLKSFFIIRQIGESLATINPTGVVGGDALKYVLMGTAGFDKDKSILSLSLLRVLTIISFILLLFACLLLLVLNNNFFDSFNLLFLALLLLSVFTYALTRFLFSSKLWLYRTSVVALNLFRVKKTKAFLNKIATLNKSTSKARHLGNTVLFFALILLMLHWLFGAVEFLLILHYLGYSISLFDAFVLEIGTSFARSLMSFIPGQIGVEEYSNKLFLEMVGVNANGVWIAVSIVRRIRQLFWIGLGVVLYLRYYRKTSNSWESSNLVGNGNLIHQS